MQCSLAWQIDIALKTNIKPAAALKKLRGISIRCNAIGGSRLTCSGRHAFVLAQLDVADRHFPSDPISLDDESLPIKQEGELLNIAAVCSTDVAIGTVLFVLKMVDENKFVRTFPGLPELDTPYFRCPS